MPIGPWWFIIPSALSALGSFFQGRAATRSAETLAGAAGKAAELSEPRYQDALRFERERIADEKARWNQVLGMTERAYQDMTPYRQVGQGAIMTLGSLTGTGPGQPARGSVLLQRGRRLGPGSPRSVFPRQPSTSASSWSQTQDSPIQWPRGEPRGDMWAGGFLRGPDGQETFVPGYRYRTEDEYRRRFDYPTGGQDRR